MFREPLFTVIMGPKRMSSDADSASMSKRNREVLSIMEKLNMLDIIEIGGEKIV